MATELDTGGGAGRSEAPAGASGGSAHRARARRGHGVGRACFAKDEGADAAVVAPVDESEGRLAQVALRVVAVEGPLFLAQAQHGRHRAGSAMAPMAHAAPVAQHMLERVRRPPARRVARQVAGGRGRARLGRRVARFVSALGARVRVHLGVAALVRQQQLGHLRTVVIVARLDGRIERILLLRVCERGVGLGVEKHAHRVDLAHAARTQQRAVAIVVNRVDLSAGGQQQRHDGGGTQLRRDGERRGTEFAAVVGAGALEQELLDTLLAAHGARLKEGRIGAVAHAPAAAAQDWLVGETRVGRASEEALDSRPPARRRLRHLLYARTS